MNIKASVRGQRGTHRAVATIKRLSIVTEQNRTQSSCVHGDPSRRVPVLSSQAEMSADWRSADPFNTLSTNASPMITPKMALLRFYQTRDITALIPCKTSQLPSLALVVCAPLREVIQPPAALLPFLYDPICILREMACPPTIHKLDQYPKTPNMSQPARHNGTTFSLLTSFIFIYGLSARIRPVATNQLRLRFRGAVASALIVSRLFGRGCYRR
jgi:hypothetical protein